MRISDWSSDVCSSDLLFVIKEAGGVIIFGHADQRLARERVVALDLRIRQRERALHAEARQCARQEIEEILRADLDALEVDRPDVARGGDQVIFAPDLLLPVRRDDAVLDRAIIADRKSTRLNSSH